MDGLGEVEDKRERPRLGHVGKSTTLMRIIDLQIIPVLMIIYMRWLMQDERRRWAALTVVCLGQLMMILDATIVNVALPFIQSDLGFSQADVAWVLDAYMVAFGSFLLLAGRLGDLVGRKRVFLAGLVLFTAA